MPRTRVRRNAITFDVLVSLFNYTMDDAAQRIGTSVSMLKRACRDHGTRTAARGRVGWARAFGPRRRWWGGRGYCLRFGGPADVTGTLVLVFWGKAPVRCPPS